LAKILFFNIPAYGHVNPTLPVVRELVQRGHEVIYYDSLTLGDAIRASGAEFRPYPDSSTSEADLAKRIHNLVTVSVFILQETIRLLPFCLDAMERENPDLVMFDSIALWGMQATRLKHIKSAASISTFVQDGVRGLFKVRDYLHIFRQAFTSLPTIQRLRRQLVQTYGPDIFPGSSILPCKGDFNLVYTSREFQPDTPYVDDSFTSWARSLLPRGGTSFPGIVGS
jgi:MGT family glycosyltransferase